MNNGTTCGAILPVPPGLFSDTGLGPEAPELFEDKAAPQSVTNGQREPAEIKTKLKGENTSTEQWKDFTQKRFNAEEKVRQESAFSKESFLRFIGRTRTAAEMAKAKFAKEGTENSKGRNATHLGKFIDRMNEFTKKVKEDTHEPDSKKFKKACKNMRRDMYEAAKKDGIPKKDIKKFFEVDALEKDEDAWQERTYDTMLQTENRKTFEVNTKITPQVDKGAYSESRFGRSSNAKKNTEHLVNRWVSSAEIYDEEVISMARHGCTRGTDEATKELVATALASKVDVSNLEENIGTKENPIQLDLANIQLMTPNKFAGDRDLPFKQMDAIKKLAEGSKENPIEVEVPVKDKNGKVEHRKVFVTVKDHLLLNFGCNWQMFGASPMPSVFSLKENDKRNAPTMERLFGRPLAGVDRAITLNSFLESYNQKGKEFQLENEISRVAKCFGDDSIVGKYLKDKKNALEDRRVVALLSAQIVDIWRNNRHLNDARNPYAIQERLAVLTYKLGYAVSINCKSGKDRTGMVCAAAETLAAETLAAGMASDGSTGTNKIKIVPDPYDMSMEHRTNVSAMITGSGSTDIARANTGVEGLRVIHPKKWLTGVLAPGFRVQKTYGEMALASSLAGS
ncbi:MAG: hypothetical protein LBI61_01645 [Puniceicoccales bacterium]|nr:hypothetical protein [Puniceicoccales bacterium]